MMICLLIWARLGLVGDIRRTAVCASPAASVNADASWHAQGTA